MAPKSEMLSEHQAPISTSQQVTPDKQPKKDQAEIKMVLDLLRDGKAAKSDVSKDWDTYWEFFNDEQWGKKRPANKSNASLNIIKVTINSLLPILTDAKPGFNALASDPTDHQFAQIVSQLTESWWEKKELNSVLIEVLMDAMIYSAGIMKVTWDKDSEMGIGEVKTEVIDPREIYVPYNARDFDRNCPWVIHLMNKPIGELKRKFPNKADVITGDSKKDDSEKESSKTKVTLVSPVDQEPSVKNQSTEDSANDIREEALVAECWMDSEAIEEYWEENKETGEKEKKFKKKYPQGKVITILVNKKILLSEVKNPYNHGKKPFIRFIDTIIPRRFWGEGEAKPLLSTQKLLNKTLANIVDYMNMTSNPWIITEKGNGVNINRLTNSYGLVIQTNADKINTIKRDIPPPLPPYIKDFYNTLREAAETISGASDITQGRRPIGITAAAAIETVQEAAHTRVRLKERNLQVSLGQLGRMVIALMMQYYTAPRVTRITGKDGWPEYFEFFVEPLEDGNIRFNKTSYEWDEENQKYIVNEKVQQGKPSKGIFDIKVLSGTSLPFAKAQRSNLALRLHEAAAIDQEELLESLEWPNKEDVLRRMQEKAEADAQNLPPGGV